MPVPKLVITSGEPAGIGPEVTLKALLRPYPAQILVLGSLDWLKQLVQTHNLPLTLHPFTDWQSMPEHNGQDVFVMDHPLAAAVTLGQLDPSNANYVRALLTRAHDLAILQHCDGIVTAPVHKGVLHQEHAPFTGHTEFFAAASGVDQVVMMLASAPMNMALATTHLPLAEVAQSISRARLLKIFAICQHSLQAMGIAQPRIRVLGLNPHAGEQGHLGSEELSIIQPAIREYQAQLPTLTGPYPADTAFSPAARDKTDLYIAMYHDQGLPVIKYASFGQCANVTLGLPYLRTSVDHGTALDIAANFCADPASMVYAIDYALNNRPSH